MWACPAEDPASSLQSQATKYEPTQEKNSVLQEWETYTDATTPHDASEAHGFAINLSDYVYLSAPHFTSL